MSTTNLTKALVAAQKDFKAATKSTENPFFKSKYADLSAIWDAVKEPLNLNGLAVSQTLDYQNGETLLITTLLHTSGESLSGKVRVKPIKDDPQSFGSAITYFRRYSLAAILGVVTEDDDGAQASETTVTPTTTHSVSAPSSVLGFTGAKALLVPFGRDKGKPVGSLSLEQMQESLSYWKPRIDADKLQGKQPTKTLSDFIMALEACIDDASDVQDIPF